MTHTHTYIYTYIYIYIYESHAVVSNSVTSRTVPCQAPLSMELPRPEYWLGCHRLQGIIPTQGLNPGLPLCRQILYHLSPREAL